eukprot:514744_1
MTETIVKILPKITIKSISNIDMVNQTFDAELDFELKWRGTEADHEKYRYKLLFPKFKPVISILNAEQIKYEFTLKRSNFTEDTIRYKCVKDVNNPGVTWILHSFTLNATFYNNFQSNIHQFPFDYHILSMQIKINKVPVIWDDSESDIRFEIGAVDKQIQIRPINLPINWRLNDNYTNTMIEVRSNKSIDTFADLLLNGFALTITEFEKKIPSTVIKLINERLGDNKDWMNEPIAPYNIIDIKLKINRNHSSSFNGICRILLTILLITILAIPSVLYSDFGQSLLHCAVIIFAIILMQLISSFGYKLQSLSFTTVFDKYCYCCVAYVCIIAFVNYIVFTH